MPAHLFILGCRSGFWRVGTGRADLNFDRNFELGRRDGWEGEAAAEA